MEREWGYSTVVCSSCVPKDASAFLSHICISAGKAMVMQPEQSCIVSQTWLRNYSIYFLIGKEIEKISCLCAIVEFL